jgi:hypothetical protein
MFNVDHHSYLTNDELAKLSTKYKSGKLKATPKENLIINPKIAYHVSEQMIQDTVKKLNLDQVKLVYGEISKLSLQDPVANLNWDYLYFVNSDYFRPAAIAFEESERNVAGTSLKPSYTKFVKGTKSYDDFWEEEFRRIVYGYEPVIDGEKCGVRISGEFYFYLNYSRIILIEELDDGTEINRETFPQFLTMDYYYFKELEARENPQMFGLPKEFKRSICLVKSRRKGFEQPLTARLYSEHYPIDMAQVSVGDKIWGPNGELVSVTDIHPQGFKDVYNLHLLDGRVIECGENHLWEVFSKKDCESKNSDNCRDKKIIKTKELLGTKLISEFTNNNAYTSYIRLSKPVFYSEKQQPLDPYLVGYFIGDDNISRQCKISSADQESLDRLLNIINNQFSNKYILTNSGKYNYQFKYLHKDISELRFLKKKYRTSKFANRVNPLYEELKLLNLATTSLYKRIPNEYKYGSYDQRLALLQGLLDSDGSINKDGQIDICCKSKYLAEDICEVGRSLGMKCTYDGIQKSNGCYRVYIETVEKVFRLKRKLIRQRFDQYFSEYVAITKIEKLPYQELQQCITVDSDDHMYLTDGYTPTHNSYKAAAGCAWIIAFNKKARVGIASEANSSDANDAIKCARKVIPIIDHLSDYTPFGRKKVGDPKNNGGWVNINTQNTNNYFSLTLGLKNTKTKAERGRMSTVFTMSLSKDDAASGEGLNRLYFEESGKVSNLDKAWIFSRESMKAGSLFRGLAVLFGTGGSMISDSGGEGSSRAFSRIFNNPVANEVASYDNIYEYKNTDAKCGYFVADMWAHFGAYIFINGKEYKNLDKQGNAHFWVSELCLNKDRAEKAPPKGEQKDYNKFLTQRCKTPSEAFLVTSSSVFNSADLIARINEIRTEPGGFDKYRVAGDLVELSTGKVEFRPNPNLVPILNRNYNSSNREGCLLVYENPIYINGSIPEDAYMIVVDPIGKNNSGGKSLNAVIVLKTPKYAHQMGPEKIVATYYGRKNIRPLDYLHSLLIKLSKYYNAKISHETDQDGGILTHFAHTSNLIRLMGSPKLVTKKFLPNSKTLLREFGHSMANDRLKSIGENYLNEWLDFRHPTRTLLDNETGQVVKVPGKRNMDLIYDEFLLDELVNYNRGGNFDAVLAMMGFAVQLNDKFTKAGGLLMDQSYIGKVNRDVASYINNIQN